MLQGLAPYRLTHTTVTNYQVALKTEGPDMGWREIEASWRNLISVLGHILVQGIQDGLPYALY